ncbi:MAG: hypothetical protein FVQ79_10230 [Planctomycetes bacterium]|nr:hypothetical protein [Planctomycetota bacterium]
MITKCGKWILVAAVLVSCFVSFSAADDGGVSFDITNDFYSKYIWRGQNLNDDYAYQPGIGFTYAGLTGGVWGSLDLTDITDNEGEFTEVDYYLDYSGDVPGIDGLGFSIGVINYHFPSVVGDTTEVYWGFGLDMPLSPTITVYHDVDVADGTYISFGLSHSVGSIVEIAPDVGVGMDIGASLGWGDSNYNKQYWSSDAQAIDSSGLNDLALSVSFPVELGGWTFAPSLNYVTLLDSEIRRSDNFNSSSDYFFTGLSLSTSF